MLPHNLTQDTWSQDPCTRVGVAQDPPRHRPSQSGTLPKIQGLDLWSPKINLAFLKKTIYLAK